MMGFGLVIPLLLIAVMVYALGWRPHINQPSQHPHTNQSTSLEILKTRYARGEIGREEYEEMRRDLEA